MFVKYSLPLQMEEQLAASIDIVQDKVQLGVGLELVVQAHQESMADIIEKHIPLRYDVLHFVGLNDGFLVKHLDSIAFPDFTVFCQVHLAREREKESRVRQ